MYEEVSAYYWVVGTPGLGTEWTEWFVKQGELGAVSFSTPACLAPSTQSRPPHTRFEIFNSQFPALENFYLQQIVAGLARRASPRYTSAVHIPDYEPERSYR